MQCSRCSYIQFKSSSKCANCGYDFKKQKSNVHADADNTFTIFATVGAAAVSGNAPVETTEDFQQESPMPDMNGLYDSPSDELTDHNETDVESFEDFELDLSDANGPDSESWDIGATLTGDLSESASVASEDYLKDEDLETGETEVQGLGFDLNADPTDTELTKEADSEMDDFFLPEPEQNLDTDSGEITLETELPIENTESDQEQTSQTSVELEAPEIELNPTIELEELQLDLETDAQEVEPKQADPSPAPEASLEGLELKMDSDEDIAKPLFPGEEPTEEPTSDR
jgi:hypothetical protein